MLATINSFRQVVLLSSILGLSTGTQFRAVRKTNASDGETDLSSTSGTTAWESRFGAAPHCANEECYDDGHKWEMPGSPIGKRFSLIADAMVIFEVGGNIGIDLDQYAKKFPAAKVFSFEPIPELYSQLATIAGKYGPNVHIKQLGVSNSDRNETFTVNGENGEGTSALHPMYGKKVTVSLRDVDALLLEVENATGQIPDVVTMNCEGCEYDVLKRMMEKGWLQRIKFVQMSWHDVHGVADRVAKRCDIEKKLWENYEPAYHSLYGWQGWRLKSGASNSTANA